MAETTGEQKRLSINLSFLAPTDSTKPTGANKSPKIFEEPNGVVGLGILAALDNQDPDSINGGRSAVLAISPKSASNPIPILSDKKFSEDDSSNKLSGDEMGVGEEYTCVISHIGENLIKKEYFEADHLGNNNGSQRLSVVKGNGRGYEAVSDSSASGGGGGGFAALGIADFLNSCFLCKKMLHGLDIFMYR